MHTYVPAISLPGLCPTEMSTCEQKNLQKLYTKALFVIAPNYKYPKFPSKVG